MAGWIDSQLERLRLEKERNSLGFEQIKVELQDSMGSDRGIAESAWTSSLDFERKALKTDSDVERIVKMLAKEKHGTPFESVVFKLWIRMPIMIDRQWVTYRIASHNGLSGRYRTVPTDFYKLPPDIQQILYKMNLPFPEDYVFHYEIICKRANDVYKSALIAAKKSELENKITNQEYKRLREVMRGMLPQANMTERSSIFNLRSIANLFKQRISEHAQPEIKNVADKILIKIKESSLCPIALKELELNGWEI